MKEYRTTTSFEKAFIIAIPNFDRNKIWFEHPRSSHGETKVCFMLNDIIKKVPMYKDEDEINTWKNYFIEYLETGKFDMNAYWELYDKGSIHPDDVGKVYKFPFERFYDNEFGEHSKEMTDFLSNYRMKYKNCGINRVPKPPYVKSESNEPKIIKGFITGSFRPFHAGHMALIEYGKQNCDKLTILITTLPDEVISYKYRLSWVLSTYLNDPKVDIINTIIEEPSDLSYDDLSRWWGQLIKNKFGSFDRLFTSEDYGKVFAKSMGAENWVYDKARNILPISATEIREKPITNWEYINNFAKDYFVKKIAIVGTESTGKTVMSQQLAEYFNTDWCPELGRKLTAESKEVTMDLLKLIGVEHAKHILRHTRNANKILIVDTDLSITKSYAKFIFGEVPKYDDWVEKANELDLYIYLDSNAPYVDDGTRFEKEKRNLLGESHLEVFKNSGIELNRFDFDTAIPKEEAYEKRFKWVVECIENFIKKY